MGFRAKIPYTELILIVLVLVITTTATSGVKLEQATDTSKAFKIDFDGLNLDPSTWTDVVKAKVSKSAIATAYVFYLGGTPPLCLFWFIFHYSLLKLDWCLVFFTSATFYGYRRGGKVIMAGGFLASYLYAFGTFTL